MSVGAIFSAWRNSIPHVCFVHTSCQAPFCQTAPLPPVVTWQQHVMESWQEGPASTAIPPTSASDIVG